MANSDKDILITPNKGTTSLPELSFVGQVNSPIKLRVLDDNTLSFEGSAGQLFSINNNLTTGTIFAVSDVSGVPSLSVDASGPVRLAYYNGYTQIGGALTSLTGSAKLEVVGNIRTSGKLIAQNGTAADWDSTQIYSDGTTSHWNATGAEYGMALEFDGSEKIRIENTGKTKLGGINRNITTDSKMTTLMVRGGDYSGTMGTTTSAIKIFPAAGGPSGRTNLYNSGISFQHLDPSYSGWGEGYSGSQAWIGLRTYDTPGQERDYLVFGTNSNTAAGSEPNARLAISPFGDVYIGTDSFGTSYKLNVTGDINFTGNLYQGGSIFKTLPTQTATTDGSVLRTRWNSSTSAYEAYWTHDLDANYRLENPDQWSFRYIINRGYTVAGYQNANPWRNGNRTAHASDVTISIGDVIDYSAAYIGGSHNGVNLFVYNCANSWLPASAATCSMSMITETNRGLNSSWNDTRARSYSGAWIDFMGNQWRNNAGRNRAYISSGNGNTSRHDLNTEAMISEIGGNIAYVAHAEGEFFAWVSQGQNRFEFSTETYTSWSSYSPAPGCDGINKHQATRIGFFYASEGGNTNRSVTKRRDSDAVILRSGISKPESGGEENLHTGMNKGYCISNYNYAQNNNAWIYQYYNDVIRFADGTLTYRKGIPGASSGTGQEGGDMMGAGVAPRTYMTYAGGQQVAPGTMAYGGSTGATQQGGAAVADGSGATGGIGTY